MIDTGVAYLDQGATSKAPDLAGTTFKPGYDFVWDDDQPVDLDGHGTHVTGTVAETTNNNIGVAGLAFNVAIMPIKALFTDWDEALGAPVPVRRVHRRPRDPLRCGQRREGDQSELWARSVRTRRPRMP